MRDRGCQAGPACVPRAEPPLLDPAVQPAAKPPAERNQQPAHQGPRLQPRRFAEESMQHAVCGGHGGSRGAPQRAACSVRRARCLAQWQRRTSSTAAAAASAAAATAERVSAAPGLHLCTRSGRAPAVGCQGCGQQDA